MKFECFVFDEYMIILKDRRLLNNIIHNIFKSKTLIKIFKSKKISSISFSIVLVENLQGKKLNKYFRQKNTIPDILSFPFNEKDKNKYILGDMVITPRKLKQNYVTVKEGYQKLLVHGLLHLLGFDHIREKDFQKMNSFENIIYQELNN